MKEICKLILIIWFFSRVFIDMINFIKILYGIFIEKKPFYIFNGEVRSLISAFFAGLFNLSIDVFLSIIFIYIIRG